eukprot:TRINITY_DN7210_c0_g1_i7.p5 TRINITY_DN7210_c0_g1~~TRINITY_DN7210_c0_g1_i7.p5  ORF type:complete len:108 (+),score=9.97 TRINITY_DN7210_c0_g1_i7:401-724(+)
MERDVQSKTMQMARVHYETMERNPQYIFLFDLVYEEEDRDTLSWDTYPTRLTKERTIGNLNTRYNVAHTPPTNFSKRQYARKPIVRDTFYRKMNILFPAGCATMFGE